MLSACARLTTHSAAATPAGSRGGQAHGEVREALLGQWTASTQLQETLVEAAKLLPKSLVQHTENDMLAHFAVRALLSATRLDLHVQARATAEGQARDLVRRPLLAAE